MTHMDSSSDAKAIFHSRFKSARQRMGCAQKPKPVDLTAVAMVAPAPAPVLVVEPHDRIGDDNRKIITAAAIKLVICKHFMLPVKSLRANHNYVWQRQIGMFLCRKHTKLSLKQIADKFGCDDHTSAIHSINKIALMQHEYPLREHLASIRRELGISEDMLGMGAGK